MRKDRIASLTLRSIVWSRREQEVLGDLLRDRRGTDRAAAGAEILQVDDDGARKTGEIDARMLIEILVFGREERRLDAIRNSLDRQEEAASPWHIRPSARRCRRERGSLPAARSCSEPRNRGDPSSRGQIDGNDGCHAEHQNAANAEEISNQSDHQPATGIFESSIGAGGNYSHGPRHFARCAGLLHERHRHKPIPPRSLQKHSGE